MATKQITREAAVELFEALGITSAKKWNAKRMAGKLGKIDEMVDDDTKLEGRPDETLTAVLEAIEADEEIEVTGAAGDDQDAGPGNATTDAPDAPDADKAKTKTKTKAKAKKDTPAKPKEETIPGVRKTRTRPYLAGTIIKKHGMEAGVTDEMVAELDELYGKSNPAESMFTLRNAWHAIRGFNEKNPD